MRREVLWVVVFLALTITPHIQVVADARVTSQLAGIVNNVLSDTADTFQHTKSRVQQYLSERPEIASMIIDCVKRNVSIENSLVTPVFLDTFPNSTNQYTFEFRIQDAMTNSSISNNTLFSSTNRECSVVDLLAAVAQQFVDLHLIIPGEIKSGPMEAGNAHTSRIFNNNAHGTRPGIGSGFLFGSNEFTLRTIWNSSLVALFMWGLLLMMLNFGSEESAFTHFIDVMQTSSTQIPIRTQMERWRTIKTIFPSFQRWYDVYTHPVAQFTNEAGTYRVCHDWLPYMYAGFNTKTVVETLGPWDDTLGIFEPNIESPAIRKMSAMATAAEMKWRKVRDDSKNRPQAITPAKDDASSESSLHNASSQQKETPSVLEESLREKRKTFLQYLTQEHKKEPKATDSRMVKTEPLADDGKVLDDMMNYEHSRRKIQAKIRSSQVDSQDIDRSVCPPNFSILDEKDPDELKEILEHFAKEFEKHKLNVPHHLTDFVENTDKNVLVKNVRALCFQFSMTANKELEAQVGRTVTQIREMVKKYFENPESCSAEERDWCRWWNFKYTLSSRYDEIQEYFESEGPRYRLRYILPTQNDVDDEVAVTQHQQRKQALVLPKEDLKMCWRIMETAMFTIGHHNDDVALTSVSVAVRSLMTAVVAALAVVMAVTLVVRLVARQAAGSAYLHNCEPLELPLQSDLRVLCTDGWMAGSTCSVTCVNGKRFLLASGMPAPTMTTCVGGHTWEPALDAVALMCSDVRLDLYSMPAMGY